MLINLHRILLAKVRLFPKMYKENKREFVFCSPVKRHTLRA